MIDQSPIAAALAGNPATASGFIGKAVRSDPIDPLLFNCPDYTTIR
jgi:hypothetical protein